MEEKLDGDKKGDSLERPRSLPAVVGVSPTTRSKGTEVPEESYEDEIKRAMQEPRFLADMREVKDDFK